MRGLIAGIVMAGLSVSLAGCSTDQEREWKVAANPRASVDDIIDAGHATGIATGGGQTVISFEVDPEDDEGPYQGAWRLYDRDDRRVADGTFGTVNEASAGIGLIAVRGGFLLSDYVKHKLHFLDRRGKLTPAHLAKRKAGSSLAGGILSQDEFGGPNGLPAWSVILPSTREVVPLTTFPDPDWQGQALTADGTLWVLLPWREGGPYRLAHAKNGVPPWTTETIPLPTGSGTSGQGLFASGNRVFVVARHEKGDRLPVDAILSRSPKRRSWTTIDATGIGDTLTIEPTIQALPNGRLLAISGGEGDWIQKPNGGFRTLRPPQTNKHTISGISVTGKRLWASEVLFGNPLHYSDDSGKTWREFER